MTARDIITRRLNHQGTAVTPYEVPIEDELHERLAAYYKDADWKQKKLRSQPEKSSTKRKAFWNP